MPSSRTPDPRVAEVARRRLEALAVQLDAAASEPDRRHLTPHPGPLQSWDGSDEQAESTAGRHARRAVPAGHRVRDWWSDRLPPALQGRLGLGPAQVGLLAALAAAALLVTTWWVSGEPEQTVVPHRPAAAVVATPTAAAPGTVPVADLGGMEGLASQTLTGADAEAAVVVVHVAGRVHRPGIVVLPVGSRVVDALRAAGGARRGVDLTALNLARLLSDGEQVLVGVRAPAGIAAGLAAGSPAAPDGLVNLNSADQTALESLPGVGPVTAGAILAWREENGAFSSVDELLEVSGIGEKTLAQIAPHVTL